MAALGLHRLRQRARGRRGRASLLAAGAVGCALFAAATLLVPLLGIVVGAAALVLGAVAVRRRPNVARTIVAAAIAAVGAYGIVLGVAGMTGGENRAEGPPPTVTPESEPGSETGQWMLLILSPVVATLGAGGGALITHRERRRSRRLREAFRRFVPEPVADELLGKSDLELRLGGMDTEGTVMFTDIRGFTTFSESRLACDVITVLNRYLTEMTDAILDQGGTLVSYSGDGIMAVFGAPIEQPDHADRALAAAREILHVRLPRFNEWLRSQGIADGFRIGVGLNSGTFVSGNVGSERRLEYTAIGDTINAAARLEESTKGTPHALFLSEAARRALRVSADDLVHVGDLVLRGRQGTVDVWTLGPERDALSSSAARS